MYNIGDKVLYPMHGAGVIEAIEEHEVFGKVQTYYVMCMPLGDMKVMIPMSSADEVGIRNIINADCACDVLRKFVGIEIEENANWNKRYRENLVKIKSGDILEVAEVVKCLMFRDGQKGLSTGERKMLSNARQILVSEVALATGRTSDEIEVYLKETVKKQIESGI